MASRKNYFVLRLLKVFGVVYRLQPVWRGEMVYPHILSSSAASIAQLHTARMGVFGTKGISYSENLYVMQEMKDRVLKEMIFSAQ